MKSSLTYFGLLVFNILNLGCKDSKDAAMNQGPFGMCISSSVYITIKDAKGTDLLDPSNPKSLRRFRVSYQIDGEGKLYYDPWMKAPYGYVIEKFAVNDHYHLQVFANYPNMDNDNSHECITYLEFEDGNIDTIAASYEVKPGYLGIYKASYNEKYVLDASKNNGNLGRFQLVKP
jgi:hypothetical protein